MDTDTRGDGEPGEGPFERGPTAGDDVFTLEGIVPMPASLHVSESTEGEMGVEALSGDWQKVAARLGARVTSDGERPPSSREELLVRMRERTPDAVELGETYLRNEKEHGHRTWYGWSNSNWGTKWDCSDPEWGKKAGRSGVVEVRFNTAWSPPIPALLKATEGTGIKAVCAATDEGGAFDGFVVMEDGDVVSEEQAEGHAAGAAGRTAGEMMRNEGFDRKGGDFSSWPAAARAALYGTASAFDKALKEGAPPSGKMRGDVTFADILLDRVRRGLSNSDFDLHQILTKALTEAPSLLRETTCSGLSFADELGGLGWRRLAEFCGDDEGLRRGALWRAIGAGAPATAEALAEGLSLSVADRLSALGWMEASGSPACAELMCEEGFGDDNDKARAILAKAAADSERRSPEKSKGWLAAMARAEAAILGDGMRPGEGNRKAGL